MPWNTAQVIPWHSEIRTEDLTSGHQNMRLLLEHTFLTCAVTGGVRAIVQVYAARVGQGVAVMPTVTLPRFRRTYR
jgi:hypothetical protein